MSNSDDDSTNVPPGAEHGHGDDVAAVNPPPTPVDAGPPPASPVTFPTIAGFWRRILAFAADILLLGVAGQALAWPLSAFWFRIGPNGRFFGELIALAYFVVLDSHLGKGQTVGQRILRIAVRNRDNRPMGIGRSALRTLLWLTPWALNGWALPLLRNHVASWLTGVIIYGVGSALAFTMAFNRRSRQGLHDMLCGTYVVNVDGARVNAFPTAARLQWIASAVLIVAGVALSTISLHTETLFGESLAPVTRLQGRLEPDRRFFSVGVSFNTSTFYQSGLKTTTRSLGINAWCKGQPSDDERQAMMNDLAKTALQTVDDIDQYDLLQISLMSAYDLGIASGHYTHKDGETIGKWRRRTGMASAPESESAQP